jgi:hypothetical protein
VDEGLHVRVEASELQPSLSTLLLKYRQSGFELLEAMRLLPPASEVVVTVGFAQSLPKECFCNPVVKAVFNKPLDPQCCGFEFQQGFWVLSCEDASYRNFCRSTQVPLKVVDFKLLAPYCCGFESQQGLSILSCVKAIQLAYRMLVMLLGCLFVPEIMH